MEGYDVFCDVKLHDEDDLSFLMFLDSRPPAKNHAYIMKIIYYNRRRHDEAEKTYYVRVLSTVHYSRIVDYLSGLNSRRPNRVTQISVAEYNEAIAQSNAWRSVSAKRKSPRR